MDGETLRENLNSLPEEIREAVIQVDFNSIVDRIAREHSLSERQVEIFDHDSTAALVGAIHPNKLSDSYQESNEVIGPEKASELHIEFYTRVLAPTMQEAKDRGFSFFDRNKEVHLDSLQSKEDLIRIGNKYHEAATKSVREITDEQRTFFQKYIREKTNLLSRGCPTCGGTQYDLIPTLKYIPTVSPGGQANIEVGAPYFEIICSNCKSSHFFNAFMMDAPGLNP